MSTVDTLSSNSSSLTCKRQQLYLPKTDFKYRFEGNRTFSRTGSRRAPSRIRSSTPKSKLAPEDAVAFAQVAVAGAASVSSLLHSPGKSLLLQSAGAKVRPHHFLELDKIARQPPQPVTSTADSDVIEPKMTKHLIRRRLQTSPQTRSPLQRFHDMMGKSAMRPFTVPTGNSAYNQQSLDADRCIRCQHFPDIQIDGRSLNRLMANGNRLQAREHCEVLGPLSCPDCKRTHAQKLHHTNCVRRTPAISTDVYKLALIHERAPHLTMREVQRKVYDGEISDHVVAPHPATTTAARPRSPVPVMTSSSVADAEPDWRSISFEDEIPVAVTSSKPNKLKAKAQVFDAIPETREEDSPPEAAPEVTYVERKPETTHVAEIVPPRVPPAPSRDDEKIVAEALASRNSGASSTGAARSASKASAAPRCFTAGAVPSDDFFFDIGDLARRLNRTTSRDLREKMRQEKMRRAYFKALAIAAAAKAFGDSVADARSTASDDSFEPHDESEMTYEPPVMFDGKGRYLGVKAPDAGRLASVSGRGGGNFAVARSWFR